MKVTPLFLLLLIPFTVYGQGVEASRIRKTTFANLGTPANSNERYCSDCTPDTTPCAGGGTGAVATRVNGAWNCAGTAAGAPADPTYITQTPDATLTNEQALSLLATGIPLITTTTGVISISSVTNDVQTKAAIVPNTAPSAGQILAGNAGGTAYVPVSLSQDCTISSTGVVTCLKTNNVSFGALATVAPGTGIATALAVNVGSAGAPVLFNGAGGTPSSLTGTNITGTAAGFTVGTATDTASKTGTGSVYVVDASPTLKGTIGIFSGATTRMTIVGGESDNIIATSGGTNFRVNSSGSLVLATNGTTAALSLNTAQAATFAGTLTVSGITSDATHTDSSVCQDTTTHQFYAGSGAAGICLGTSSVRFKENIYPLALGLREIVALKPVIFNYKNGYGDNGARRQNGFLAEDVEKIIPSLVGRDKEGRPQSVDYMGILPLMVNAFREVNARVERLENEKSNHRNISIRRHRHARAN